MSEQVIMLTPEQITRVVVHHFASRFEFSEDNLKSKSRKAEYVRARQMWCQLVKEEDFFITLKKMGKLLGDKHHSTIIHALQEFESKFSTESSYRVDYSQLRHRIIEIKKATEYSKEVEKNLDEQVSVWVPTLPPSEPGLLPVRP